MSINPPLKKVRQMYQLPNDGPSNRHGDVFRVATEIQRTKDEGTNGYDGQIGYTDDWRSKSKREGSKQPERKRKFHHGAGWNEKMRKRDAKQ